MRLLTINILCLFSTLVSAQNTTIQVIDYQTENPVSFAKISDGTGNVLITDIDGKATINIDKDKSYSFRFFEYQDLTVRGYDLLSNNKVYLHPEAQVYDEVVITPGVNPAHRIIQNTMNNQKKNDPLKNNSFTYNSYSKFYITGELKEGINRDTITDSFFVDALELLDRQYLFLTETKANRTFNPPNYDKEVVTAYNVSGVKEPLFATLVNQFQSFSFYDNNFEINQKEYINPIAPGGLRRYLFILQDTLVHNETNDTTFTISYRPRTGRNFEGLEGYLYINTKDWAIEKVIASPYEQKSFKVKISQEYEYTNNKKWFPKKISTEINIPVSLMNYGDMIGRSSLYINDVEFDNVSKKGFNPVSIEVAESALADSNAIKEVRGDTYTGKESLTYQTIDSIAEDQNLDRMVQYLKIASTGVIPIWKFGIPIIRIANFNQQEGFRLGLGLETNSKMSKVVKAGGYFAYGINDLEWKWGGDLSFMLYQKHLIKLNLHYSDDVFERGGTDLYNDAFNLVNQGLYRNFFINLLDRERYAGVNLSGLIRQNIKIQLFGNYKRYSFVDDYQYLPLFSKNGTTDIFDIAETGIVLNWNIREKVMMLGDQRVSLGTKWPKITLKAVKGLSGIFESDYDYYRFNFDVYQDFKIRGFGELKLMSESGITLGNVPLTIAQIQKGTGIQFAVSVPNTFETMLPAEFFSDRYSNLFMRFSFLPIKSKLSWTSPTFGVHSAAGIGKMYNRTDHKGFDFKTPDKAYYESGLILDNLLKVNFIGMGVGVFYRYGHYKFAQEKDNLFYKFSLRFNL